MISHWFQPDEKNSIRPDRLSKNSLWHQVHFIHDEDSTCSAGDLVLISFDRHMSHRIKRHLYQFNATPSSALRIVDCGLFIQRSQEAIIPVLKDLTDSGALILLLDPPATFMKNQVNGARMVSIISESNLDDDIHLRTEPPGPMLQYLATQRHLVSESHLRIEGHLRLSDLREELSYAEPCLRDSDVVIFNCDSLSAAEAGYMTGMSSSGLTVMEACQLFRYAGASQSVSSIGIYGCNAESDHQGITANAIAQMIWYLLEGSMLREDPEKSTLTQYVIQSKENEHTFHFFKSEVSGRWWIANSLGRKIPCSYHDYRKACEEDYSGVVMRSVLGQ
jgi:hypothetical protein